MKDPLARLRRIYLELGPYASSSGGRIALAARKLGADRIRFGTAYGVDGGTSTTSCPPRHARRGVLFRRLSKIHVDHSLSPLKARGLA